MATLSLTVGPVTATRSITTAVVMESIGNYLLAYDGPVAGTNQEKIDWYLGHLIAHTREVSIGYKRRIAEQSAKESQTEATW